MLARRYDNTSFKLSPNESTKTNLTDPSLFDAVRSCNLRAAALVEVDSCSAETVKTLNFPSLPPR